MTRSSKIPADAAPNPHATAEQVEAALSTVKELPAKFAIAVDGGGRFRCELTDATPSLAIGDRVEMTFRRLTTSTSGVHNYFWKARPVRSGPGKDE